MDDFELESGEESQEAGDFEDLLIHVPDNFWAALEEEDLDKAGEILKNAVEFYDHHGEPNELEGRLTHYRSDERGEVSEPSVQEISWNDAGDGGGVHIWFHEYVHSSCKDARRFLDQEATIPFRVEQINRRVFLRVLTWFYRFSPE